MPKPSATPTANFISTLNTFDASAFAASNDIAQGIDFQGGFEFYLLKPRNGIGFPSGRANIQARLGLAFIVGGGAITPFSSDKTALQFKVNSNLEQAFPDLAAAVKAAPTSAPIDTIAFVAKERSRFFRDYYGGVRFKTYFFRTDKTDANGNALLDNVFPGIFDVAVGQNESVTGGHLRGPVVKLEGFYPLPFLPYVHVFGTLHLRAAQNKSTSPLILESPSTARTLSDPQVFIQSTNPLDRDYYRLGLGVDIVQLFKK